MVNEYGTYFRHTVGTGIFCNVFSWICRIDGAAAAQVQHHCCRVLGEAAQGHQEPGHRPSPAW